MNPTPNCDQARALAAEVALGIAPGEDRARVLAQARSCSDCRRFLQEMAETADGLLMLAPRTEPDLGFESRVLAQMRSASRSARPRIRVALVAGLVAAAAVGAAMFWVTADDRRLAAHYRHALEVADGQYFGVFPMRSSTGERSGHVFAYEGSPPWIFVIFADPLESGNYQAVIEQASGELTEIGSFDARGGQITWGRDLPVELRRIRSVRISDERGELALEATFPEPR